MYCRNIFLPAQRFTNLAPCMYYLRYKTQPNPMLWHWALRRRLVSNFGPALRISSRKCQPEIHKSPRHHPHSFQFIMHNVRFIQYSIRPTQDTEKCHWINKVNIIVLSRAMSRVLIVLHVFVAVLGGHKPIKDSSWKWRQRSSENLKSVYQTTRCRIAEDRTNDVANIENVWDFIKPVAGGRKQQWAIMRYSAWWPAFVIRCDFGRQWELRCTEDFRSYPAVSESLVKGHALITFNLTGLLYPEIKPVRSTYSESN